jgi:hypothetical protein
MEEIDKILYKIEIRARKEAILELLKKYKKNPKITKLLQEKYDALPSNI